VRITEIREKTVPIASPIANAFIDFSKMTCSVVAVITDVVRDGKPVTGYGFIPMAVTARELSFVNALRLAYSKWIPKR